MEYKNFEIYLIWKFHIRSLILHSSWNIKYSNYKQTVKQPPNPFKQHNEPESLLKLSPKQKW